MEESVKTVAVIGCGVTGLAAVKCCLDEGLQPTCFEKSDAVGGLWVYREEVVHKMTGSVFKSCVSNTSKEAMCFSDFPFPKEWPNFLRHTYMKKYCEMYAERFGLSQYIHLSTGVTRLAQAPDYDTTGRWVVTAKGNNNEEETEQEFDAVMICTGMFTNPHRPEFPGMETFRGRVLHSHEYRKPKGFDDKRVVVVGFGNSAADAAVDLSRCASQVFLSTRRGAWLVSRRADNGFPHDLMYFRRPSFILSTMREFSFKRMLRGRYELITNPLKPFGDLKTCSNRVVNEELPGCILNGSVIIKTAPVRLTETGVHFQDGTYEDNIDVIILATGYRFTFPFEIDCPALRPDPKLGRVPLYRCLFPLGTKHHSLSVHGAIEPLGPVIPCVELQARWAARVFNGLAKLPSQSEMATESFETVGGFSVPRSCDVNHASYGDLIASEIGAKPNLLKLSFTDPALAFRCLFGPLVPYQYRLIGPGKWDGAREAIMTVWERVQEPTKTRQEGVKEDTPSLPLLVILRSGFVLLTAGVVSLLI